MRTRGIIGSSSQRVNQASTDRVNIPTLTGVWTRGGESGDDAAVYCDDWKTNGNDTSTEPPAGAGKRQRATRALMQLATSASPSVSCSTSTPETVPACVI